MKTLYIVRHAKSSWNHAHLGDHERPLNNRGKRDAPMMGKRLAKQPEQPDLIIASSAVRAQMTSKYIAIEIKYPIDRIVTEKRIYGAEADTILQIIQAIPAHIACAMLVGHNPTLTEFINRYTDKMIANAPTCSIAKIQSHNHDWTSFGPNSAHLVDFDYPKKEGI